MKEKNPHVFAVIKPYAPSLVVLFILTLAGNAISLYIPKLIAQGIDTYSEGGFDIYAFSLQFIAVVFGVFVFTYIQGVFQTYTAERAARDIRSKLVEKISEFTFSRLEQETESKILTNLTSDIDAVKSFISQAVVIIISSVVLIIGASTLLILIDWRLALSVLALLPVIGILFALIFSRLGPLFKRGQGIIDGLNSIISENIVGSSLVRVLHSQDRELEKFNVENANAKENSVKVLKLFSIVIPSVGIISNMAMLIILALGGKFVIAGTMTIGDFAAFNSYVIILIFPIIMLGFVSNIISRAQESYVRIAKVLDTPLEKETGVVNTSLCGELEAQGVNLVFSDRHVLRNVSFKIKAGTKTAIIGPTAAGKTQLLYTLMGLVKPTSGHVLYDDVPLSEYERQSIHSQVALVFQDSVMFNMSLRENIAFSPLAKDEDVQKAIETAELSDFIVALPQGLYTIVSERGTSLSGGQKQRIMLARALSINPRVLLLDDFTARVDQATERKILANVEKNYPGITIVSVTQKVHAVEHFEKIILLMEGEVLAQGSHAKLIETSPEYMQILESQKSTQTYEH